MTPRIKTTDPRTVAEIRSSITTAEHDLKALDFEQGDIADIVSEKVRLESLLAVLKVRLQSAEIKESKAASLAAELRLVELKEERRELSRQIEQATQRAVEQLRSLIEVEANLPEHLHRDAGMFLGLAQRFRTVTPLTAQKKAIEREELILVDRVQASRQAADGAVRQWRLTSGPVACFKLSGVGVDVTCRHELRGRGVETIGEGPSLFALLPVEGNPRSWLPSRFASSEAVTVEAVADKDIPGPFKAIIEARRSARMPTGD